MHSLNRVEIIGIPGSGKSTLVRLINNKVPKYISNMIDYHQSLDFIKLDKKIKKSFFPKINYIRYHRYALIHLIDKFHKFIIFNY